VAGWRLGALGAPQETGYPGEIGRTEAADLALDHASRWLGLRFSSEDTERQYREWRTVTATPFARVGYVGSIPSWCLLLVAVALFDSSSLPQAAPPILGWIVALVALTAATYPRALRSAVMPLAALANCVAGFLIVWLLFDVVLVDEAAEWRAGVMTGGLLVVMFFGFAIYRVPPAMAMAAVTPYVTFGSYRLYDGEAAGALSTIEAAGLSTVQWIAYLGSLLVCVVIEGVTRRTFCKDQIIGAQQRELRRRDADAARRQVERNLHDGTQQKLLSLLVGLRLAEFQLGDGVEPKVRASLAEMADHLNGAIDELRDLARGIHPAIVAEEGLAAGLVSLAERSPIPVVLEATPAERAPTDVEVTAYYIVSEAIANAAKHGHATEVRVRALLAGDALEVEVSDDGIGGARLSAGSGLDGLADRVEAHEGRFTVDSPRGGGTTLRAVIPAPARAQVDAPSGSETDRR
jgi:signal transduction histidine kinase